MGTITLLNTFNFTLDDTDEDFVSLSLGYYEYLCVAIEFRLLLSVLTIKDLLNVG